MFGRFHRPWLGLAAAGVLGCIPLASQAQVYKCRTPDGRMAYSQSSCAASGLQEAGEVKITPPPASAVPAPRPGQAPPAAPAAAVAPPRPAAPPGVDDPLGDPARPRLCAEQQDLVDGNVAQVKRLVLEQDAQAARFDELERRINQHNATPDGRKHPAIGVDNRYALRQQEKDAMTARLGSERVRLQSQLQNAYRLNCQVLGKPLRLQEAEQLQYPPGFNPKR